MLAQNSLNDAVMDSKEVRDRSDWHLIHVEKTHDLRIQCPDRHLVLLCGTAVALSAV